MNYFLHQGYISTIKFARRRTKVYGTAPRLVHGYSRDLGNARYDQVTISNG